MVTVVDEAYESALLRLRRARANRLAGGIISDREPTEQVRWAAFASEEFPRGMVQQLVFHYHHTTWWATPAEHMTLFAEMLRKLRDFRRVYGAARVSPAALTSEALAGLQAFTRDTAC